MQITVILQLLERQSKARTLLNRQAFPPGYLYLETFVGRALATIAILKNGLFFMLKKQFQISRKGLVLLISLFTL